MTTIQATETTTAKAISWALDVAMLRQQAIASNIANLHSQGYVPQAVTFGDQLTDALDLVDGNGRIDVTALASLRPQIAPVDSSSSRSVNSDTEVADMARNAVHYQSLLKGLTHHYRLLSMAAGDGKR